MNEIHFVNFESDFYHNGLELSCVYMYVDLANMNSPEFWFNIIAALIYVHVFPRQDLSKSNESVKC